MTEISKPLFIVPVLSSADIQRDRQWYEKYTGFQFIFGDSGYAGFKRDNIEFHLQFHHGTEDDPVTAGVMKIFVEDIKPYFDEFVQRETISEDKLRMNTPWGTHEFGFYDLNKNAIFFVQDA